MRTSSLLFGTAFLVGCTVQVPSAGEPPGDRPDGGAGDPGDPDAEPPPPVVDGDPFAPTTLEMGVSYLASDALGGRLSGTPGDTATRTFIEDAFRAAGLTPGGDNGGLQQAFTAPDGTHASNVIGYLPGTTLANEVILIGAHHDHLGTKAGQIYNGANDNASGTVALIAQARYIATLHPKRTIAFVAFGYEEHDGNCEGSEYFAKHAPAALAIAKIKYMVDMDMVGTYSLANEVTVYGATAGTRGRTILDGLGSTLTLTHSGNAEADDSDFQAFADKQIPYVYFETWDEACYHKPCDDANRIDYASMSVLAKLGADLVLGLAN